MHTLVVLVQNRRWLRSWWSIGEWSHEVLHVAFHMQTALFQTFARESEKAMPTRNCKPPSTTHTHTVLYRAAAAFIVFCHFQISMETREQKIEKKEITWCGYLFILLFCCCRQIL
uniref:Uncharacterized protein n=1 Tax=Trypanosoma vivax (strain Y486) TaxID=1055687 RepID=G0UD89_TRYVY|nr:hypothetical protein TVY486_1112840 [Trypanosoma vivax Y486]